MRNIFNRLLTTLTDDFHQLGIREDLDKSANTFQQFELCVNSSSLLLAQKADAHLQGKFLQMATKCLSVALHSVQHCMRDTKRGIRTGMKV